MLRQKLKSSLLAAGAAGLLAMGLGSGAANAITVGGITWDNTAPHFQVGSIFENVITGDGQTLSGYGEISAINGNAANGPGGFCAAICELTYEFGGFVSQDFNAGTGIVNFSGGWINFYVDTFPGGTANFTGQGTNVANRDAATDGTLWLTLAGHNNMVGGINAVIFGTGTSLGTGNDTGDGVGLMDVDLTGNANGNTAGAGALANAAFDKNFNPDNIGGFADFTLGSSFSNIGLPLTLAGQCANFGFLDPTIQCLTGSSDLQQNAELPTISEPAAFALFGLGLIGMGAVRRRRANA